MSKDSCAVNKQEETEHFDFSGSMEPSFDEGALSDLTAIMIEAINHQSRLAFDLTKLIVEKAPGNLNEQDIFSVFERANQLVADTLPLKSILEKIGS